MTFAKKHYIYIGIGTLVLAIILFAIFLFFKKNKDIITAEIVKVKETQIEKNDSFEFGISSDTFNLTKATIKNNATLSDILKPYNVSIKIINSVADSATNIFNVKKIRTAKEYTVFSSMDSPFVAKYFVYEINSVDYVVFKLFDTVSVTKYSKAVDTVENSLAGEINTSLWVDMHNKGASPDLINKLSDVYAWEINFFRIDKGDRFAVIYENILVENKSVGIGKIIGACFYHQQKDYYAFLFKQDGRYDYFDEKGFCLSKMLVKAPLKYSRVSSRFSNNRFHPVLKRYRPHHGVDYAASYGTPVHAAGNGVILKANYSGGAGNYVKIQHNSVYTTGYMHLSKYGKGIKKGAEVQQGDIIGYVGSTGLSTGPHLDYRVWKNGKNINPLTLDLPPVKAVDKKNIKEFNMIKEGLLKKINKIREFTN
ncbi:MAG: peptidoglycan DD-metalloendopeptidase family protein [Bacteroidota bacterium]|nr:peptidoglycan DD-metalloendopeptidase family protein [Bacteroidota bacterium]